MTPLGWRQRERTRGGPTPRLGGAKPEMHKILRTTAAALLILLCGAAASTAAQFGLGGFAHVWGEYPEGAYGLLDEWSYTAGPLASFSEGRARFDFFYGADPILAGWLGDAPEPIASAQMTLWLDELGWRVWYGRPVCVVGSYSRLHCEAEPATCETAFAAGEWLAHQISAGIGVREGPFWLLVEAGLRFWDWRDVAAAPEVSVDGALYVAAGLHLPVGGAGALEPRTPVESLPVTIEETFPVDCDDWRWEGQAGRIDNLDGALHFTVNTPEQRLMQQLPCDLGRFVLDVEITPHAAYTEGYYQGVALRYADDDNFFAVDLRADGYIRFVKVVEGVWETVHGWRRATGYEPGASNRLRIVAPGNRFIVYLNGHRLLSVREVSFRKGDVALLAGTTTGRGHSVSFDNLTLRAIPPGTVLDPRTVGAQRIELAQRTAAALLFGAGALVGILEDADAAGFAFAAGMLASIFADTTHVLYVE